MHSASFAVSAEDFQDYMRRIKALGQALGEKVPEFQSLSKDMAEVGTLVLCVVCSDSHQKFVMEHFL